MRKYKKFKSPGIVEFSDLSTMEEKLQTTGSRGILQTSATLLSPQRNSGYAYEYQSLSAQQSLGTDAAAEPQKKMLRKSILKNRNAEQKKPKDISSLFGCGLFGTKQNTVSPESSHTSSSSRESLRAVGPPVRGERSVTYAASTSPSRLSSGRAGGSKHLYMDPSKEFVTVVSSISHFSNTPMTSLISSTVPHDAPTDGTSAMVRPSMSAKVHQGPSSSYAIGETLQSPPVPNIVLIQTSDEGRAKKSLLPSSFRKATPKSTPLPDMNQESDGSQSSQKSAKRGISWMPQSLSALYRRKDQQKCQPKKQEPHKNNDPFIRRLDDAFAERKCRKEPVRLLNKHRHLREKTEHEVEIFAQDLLGSSSNESQQSGNKPSAGNRSNSNKYAMNAISEDNIIPPEMISSGSLNDFIGEDNSGDENAADNDSCMTKLDLHNMSESITNEQGGILAVDEEKENDSLADYNVEATGRWQIKEDVYCSLAKSIIDKYVNRAAMFGGDDNCGKEPNYSQISRKRELLGRSKSALTDYNSLDYFVCQRCIGRDHAKLISRQSCESQRQLGSLKYRRQVKSARENSTLQQHVTCALPKRPGYSFKEDFHAQRKDCTFKEGRESRLSCVPRLRRIDVVDTSTMKLSNQDSVSRLMRGILMVKGKSLNSRDVTMHF